MKYGIGDQLGVTYYFIDGVRLGFIQSCSQQTACFSFQSLTFCLSIKQFSTVPSLLYKHHMVYPSSYFSKQIPPTPHLPFFLSSVHILISLHWTWRR